MFVIIYSITYSYFNSPSPPDILIQCRNLRGRLAENLDCERRFPARCANFSFPQQISGRTWYL